ncbi:unnamed protein product [Pelagomonas calceolata]|uniref:gamma-glutamylcyclotransferase n=1 Tax=Pelagomonas calceolata TaxID=35677 RepID=A0A8J2S782_9STRA|nr:unnamed protein product [Pelagomonas calceolata]
MTMRTTRAAALLLHAAAAITTQTTTTTTTTLRPLPASVVDANGLVRYFAFGSNLAKSKMGSRGKNSSALAYERRWPAVAHDQRLAFNMRGFPPLEPAMAGIEPSPGQECPGCVYEMSRDAYEALWRSEGGAMKKTPYQEVVVSVRDASGRDVDAITCQVSAWAALRRDGVPSARYLGIIEEGARELGLVEYAEALSKRPRANPSRFLRAVAGAHGVVSLTLYRRNLSHLLAPLRSACFVLTYGGRRPWLRALSEALTAAVLLPTAAVGSVIRLYRSARGLPPIVFGPPE